MILYSCILLVPYVPVYLQGTGVLGMSAYFNILLYIMSSSIMSVVFDFLSLALLVIRQDYSFILCRMLYMNHEKIIYIFAMQSVGGAICHCCVWTFCFESEGAMFCRSFHYILDTMWTDHHGIKSCKENH